MFWTVPDLKVNNLSVNLHGTATTLLSMLCYMLEIELFCNNSSILLVLKKYLNKVVLKQTKSRGSANFNSDLFNANLILALLPFNQYIHKYQFLVCWMLVIFIFDKICSKKNGKKLHQHVNFYLELSLNLHGPNEISTIFTKKYSDRNNTFMLEKKI